MHPDLQKYLDGDVARAELAPELRAEADAWDALTTAARGMNTAPAPESLAARVMAALPPAPSRQPRWRSALESLIQPREVRIRPVYGVLATAAIAAVLLVPRTAPAPVPDAPTATATQTAATPNTAAPIIYVRFSFPAPDARTVALAGDFNDWQPGALTLTDADGDGVWTGTFALAPGVHKYMFIVDEERWESDPEADRYIDDGFGMRNSLIAIEPPMRRTM